MKLQLRMQENRAPVIVGKDRRQSWVRIATGFCHDASSLDDCDSSVKTGW
ncbi:MAG: hypothetical protein OSA98_04455 [Rubripirellula sp.]|jgi:hypothetical protein|nr:hypothetical protein [Rubripirellula sp.]|tara:strand:+ start:2613 stop:2762 length:150 start_codon:yes stop_codon:yes gene_type:complete